MDGIQWKPCGKTFREMIREDEAQPGLLVKVAGQGTFLVGDVNALGGVCDDCIGFDLDAVVTEYAIIYKAR